MEKVILNSPYGKLITSDQVTIMNGAIGDDLTPGDIGNHFVLFEGFGEVRVPSHWLSAE